MLGIDKRKIDIVLFSNSILKVNLILKSLERYLAQRFMSQKFIVDMSNRLYSYTIYVNFINIINIS
ncbi:hypothetical protein AAU57_13055 [Nonlabens sp. YIK11]|nr:hypothetical protein AAU57_13055 [Nonlabens sp. YIK11]